MAFIFVPDADGNFTEGEKQTNPDTGVEYIYNDGAWRALGPKIEDEFDTLDERYVTQDYVDDAIEAIPDTDLSNYLRNDTWNILETGSDFKLRQADPNGSNKTLMNIKDGQMRLYNLTEPNDSHHAATRRYVDNAVIGPRPAQLSWVYEGSKTGTTSAPANGKFYKDGDYLRFSFKTGNGVDLSDGLVDDTGPQITDYGPIGVVWYNSETDGKWKMKRQFRTASWRWNFNDHFEFKLSSSKGHAWSSFTEGVTYYITIGGWF